MIEIKKKRNVKGKRALNLGLNPHSNGLIFSNSKKYFFEKKLPKIKINILNNVTTIKIIIYK